MDLPPVMGPPVPRQSRLGRRRQWVLCVGALLTLCGCTVDFGRSEPDASAICGNGVIEAGEECDGTDLGGQDCAGLGFTAGTLFCSLCAFNAQSCYACGNGLVEPGELCDDGNQTDDLTCSADCQEFCGDSVLHPSLGEGCDGADFGGATCADHGFHGVGEADLTCDASCVVSTEHCVADCWDYDGDGYGLGVDCLGADCNEMDDQCWLEGDPCCPNHIGAVGEPCTVDGECQDIIDGTPTCVEDMMGYASFPGGYCSGMDCTTGNACDSLSGVCVDVMGVVQFCLKPCTGDGECRVADGYSCQTISASPVGDYCLPLSP